jgi:hypothetical protein
MELSGTATMKSKHPNTSEETNTRLSGRWLILARAIWILLAAFAFGLLVVGLPQLPAYFAHLQQACIGMACANANGQLSLSAQQTLARFGISPLMYAIFVFATTSLIPAVVWIPVGVILVWRKSDDWMALLVSLLLILWGVAFATGFGALAPTPLVWQIPYIFIGILAEGLTGLVLCLFPNGRFVPRWLVWVAFVFVVTSPIDVIHNLLPSFGWMKIISGPGFLLLLGLILGSQVYRYIRVSTPLQRQQTKWLLFGVSMVFLISDLGFYVLRSIFPWLGQPGSFSSVFFGTILWALLFNCIPLSIGIAMLRYRLWDIDILINRTLVYGSLTALLALLYFGLIFVLQSLFEGMFHQSNAVAVVISTLVIAALFQPLRRRIQAIIDRRFYRRKYDAAKTLEAFSATLRNEVELTQLREHLVAVVQETMQPAHVSLWLRPSEHDGKHQAPWRANPPVDSQEG